MLISKAWTVEAASGGSHRAPTEGGLEEYPERLAPLADDQRNKVGKARILLMGKDSLFIAGQRLPFHPAHVSVHLQEYSSPACLSLKASLLLDHRL